MYIGSVSSEDDSAGHPVEATEYSSPFKIFVTQVSEAMTKIGTTNINTLEVSNKDSGAQP